LGLVPLLGLNLLQYSQNLQAADLFRAAPLVGPGTLCHGPRRAVLCLLAFPTIVVFGIVAWLIRRDISHLALLVPGVIALPIYAMIPCLGGRAVPLSLPAEEAKSAGRGLTIFGVMIVSLMLSAIATWAWNAGWFTWLLLAETVVVVGIYAAMRASINSVRWPAAD